MNQELKQALIHDGWKHSMKSYFDALLRIKTWVLVPLHANRKIIVLNGSRELKKGLTKLLRSSIQDSLLKDFIIFKVFIFMRPLAL